jgi:UDPglucose 6-dehydrogenase
MKISVVGMGYVGLANAVMLAKKNQVSIAEIDPKKVDMLNNGMSPINDSLITNYLNKQSIKLCATTSHQESYKNANYIIICTPTNYLAGINAFDTSGIKSIVNDINDASFKGLIIIRSTVPIGFTEKLNKEFPKLKIAFFPEFLREGKALHDCLKPSRIICGSADSKAKKFLKVLVSCSQKKNIDTLITSSSEAESIKLFSNAYLAMRVAFFNELDSFANSRNLNAKNIINGVSLDQRIGSHYNNPSFGYGGYCLPKDTKQLSGSFGKVPHNIIRSTISSNHQRKQYIVDEIIKNSKGSIGIYKLSMKKDSDNFRESAILFIIKKLKYFNKELYIYEPMIKNKKFHGIDVVNDFNDFIKRSELIIANRMHSELKAHDANVFCRDIFNSN